MKENAIQIIKKIKSLGNYEALMVGGCVRDMLMNIEPSDYDIATNCPMELLEQNFNCHDIGKNKEFGIIVVNVNGVNYEIAQFRTESASKDGRHPDSVQFVNSFIADCARRDFTINAIGLDEKNMLMDFWDGSRDIKNKIIRTVGNPSERFMEDRLRIIRGIRFAATFDFQIHYLTEYIMIECKELIVDVSPERIKQELFKVASKGGKVMERFIRLLKKMDLLKYVLPEIDIMNECEHTITSHPEGNVFEHTLKAVAICESKDPMVVLGVLFHDIGKPPSKHYNDLGFVRYSGHDQGKYIEPLAERLKFSNEEIDFFKFVIESHMMIFELPNLKKSRAIPLVEHKDFQRMMEVVYCDTYSAGMLRNKVEQYQAMVDCAKKLIETKEPERVTRIKKAINGKWIMEKFNLTEGKIIGKYKELGITFATEGEFDFSNDEEKEQLLNNVYEYIKCYLSEGD